MGERRKAVRMFVYGKDRISHGRQTEMHYYIPARRVTRLSFPIQRARLNGATGGVLPLLRCAPLTLRDVPASGNDPL